MKDAGKIGIFGLLCVLFLGYSFYLYHLSTDFTVEAGAAADRGKKVWQDKNCIACHQIYGLGGYLGPDLTNTYSEKGPDYIKAFLRSGTRVMPDFQLSENEMEQLVRYLQHIDESGTGRPHQLKIYHDGTIGQPETAGK